MQKGGKIYTTTVRIAEVITGLRGTAEMTAVASVPGSVGHPLLCVPHPLVDQTLTRESQTSRGDRPQLYKKLPV